MDACRLVVEDGPDPGELALLENHVAAAAIAATGAGDEREFGVFLRDRSGRMRAGLSAIVWGGYCELQAMWVDKPLRRRGVARSLMGRADEEARLRGCSLMLFLAYDILAGGLYDQLGYETVAVVADCPRGSAARLYRKAL